MTLAAIAAAASVDQAPLSLPSAGPQAPKPLQALHRKGQPGIPGPRGRKTGAHFFLMPGPGFLYLKEGRSSAWGSEKVSVCGNLLQSTRGFSPSICRAVQLLHPVPEDSEDSVSGNSESTCRRPETLGNSCCCTEAALGGGVGEVVLISSQLCHFGE